MVRKIDKRPTTTARKDTTEPQPNQSASASLSEAPPDSPSQTPATEQAAQTIQRAFKKYKTKNASKAAAEQALKGKDTQREVWARRRAGQHTEAKKVQVKITDELTNSPVTKSKPVAPGKTEGTRLVATGKEKGILKPGKGWPADSNAEVAAYKLDLLLGLNAVPVTVQRSERFFGVGFRGALNRLFRKVVPEKFKADRSIFLKPRPLPEGEVPDSNQRFVSKAKTLGTGSTYYVPYLNDIKFFDRLIGNPDRHGGNLLVAEGPLETTGKPRYIAIDHGQAFRSFPGAYISWEGEIPSEAIFERAKYMSRVRFERMLSPHLDEDLRTKVWKQREDLVTAIEEWVQKNGRPSHW